MQLFGTNMFTFSIEHLPARTELRWGQRGRGITLSLNPLNSRRKKLLEKIRNIYCFSIIITIFVYCILNSLYMVTNGYTGWPSSYRKYILKITQPSQYRYAKLQYRFVVTSGSPSTVYTIPFFLSSYKKVCLPCRCTDSISEIRLGFV